MHLIEKVANSNDPSGRNEPFTDELFAISDVELAKKIEVSRACQASKGMVNDRHNKIVYMVAKYIKEEKSRTIAVLKMGPKIGKGNRMRSSK